MGKTSRTKGANFERLISRMIIEAVGAREDKVFGKQDCYRTPLSGGHPLADAGDLVISEALWRHFPYVVECKHVKSWNPAALLPPVTAQVCTWIRQAKAALRRVQERNPARKEGRWLLVMRGNNTAILTLTETPHWRKPLCGYPCAVLGKPGEGLTIPTGSRLIVVTLPDFLAAKTV